METVGKPKTFECTAEMTVSDEFFWEALFMIPAANSHKGFWHRERHLKRAAAVFHYYAKRRWGNHG